LLLKPVYSSEEFKNEISFNSSTPPSNLGDSRKAFSIVEGSQ